mgnify:CR=1 FL=1
MVSQQELIKVLDELEIQESKLLSWGDTSGYFSLDELDGIIGKILPNLDSEDVEDELRRQAIIIPVNDSTGCEIGVRTRIAEALHLYRNLRQWFHGKPIEQAKTLVSDFRYIRRSRYYPKRDLELSSLLDAWQTEFNLHSSTRKAIGHLVGDYQLSGFQSRATEHILNFYQKHQSRRVNPTASIICAGTGSGKTMAFYLPALSVLATDVLKSKASRVRALAIYPRKELLKDQLSETWEQCRKLDDLMLSSGGRKIRIGALFGDVFDIPKYALDNAKKYKRDYVSFSLLKCHTTNCRGEMRWSVDDILINKERLICNLCGHNVSGDEVALTRQSMVDNPPDILFTTTEMLNQQMGNSKRQHLFGVGTPFAIPLVLIDEVHTYEGSQGAHTAFLLRRWMKLSKNRPHFVGLSATLTDAENFFGDLTGTKVSNVRLIEPFENEMVEEGAEYLLALRGDPVSQTALLSTTIQTTMLTHRILDTTQDKISNGTWGNKVFVFTDDLDVNNRLFSGVSDAEGWFLKNYKLIENTGGPLAQLRNPATTTVADSTLLTYGQDWSVAKTIGFTLDNNDRAKVTRTSSQDSGYDHSAEIIVTTATLEVGFNDAEVGAVIQHKAPKGVASYLQRKGRAGRQRIMRPLMIIVLSEFGRDRVAYQQYEKLVDPEVKLMNLPIDNSHVQKMQASLAVLDWFSLKMEGKSHLWYSLNNPQKNKTELDKLLPLINDVLEFKDKQDELADYLRSALKLESSEAALNRILWQSPRSIFMEFLPTLRRRILYHWAIWSDDTEEAISWADLPSAIWGSPVPGFIPDSSFSDLNAPDVQIQLVRANGIIQWEGMSFFQSLREFSPGRISKRYAVSTGLVSDWLVPKDFRPTADMDGTFIDFSIDEAFGVTKTLIASVPLNGTENTIDVYQPTQIFTLSLFNEQQLSETSNAFLRWQSVFIPSEYAESSDVPQNNSWSGLLKDMTFFTHAAMTPLELVRFNTGSDAEFKYKTGGKVKTSFRWTKGDDDSFVAIGSSLFVDALRLQFLLDDQTIINWLEDAELLFSIRNSVLQDLLRDAPIFKGNQFFSDWVYECFIAAVVLELSLNSSSIELSIKAVCSLTSVVKLDKIPEMLFQQDISNVDENSSDVNVFRDQKLQQDLKESLVDPHILSVLNSASRCLYLPVSEQSNLIMWCRNVFANTLTAATQQVLCILLPNADERSINADPVVDNDLVTVWLSEVESGGSGVISQLQESYTEDPVRFINVLNRCLQAGDYEQLDFDLQSILKKNEEGGDVTEALSAVRSALNYEQRLSANKKLKYALTSEGYFVSHSFSAILYSRILRPGSNKDTDRQLLGYLSKWLELENKCGFEVPMNIAAFILVVEKENLSNPLKIFKQACNVQSVLWSRGSSIRQSSLQYYNPFQVNNIRTERLLAAKASVDDVFTVIYKKDTWLKNIYLKLNKSGKVNLTVSRDFFHDINKVIAAIQVESIDTHGLLFYPRVTSIRRDKNDYIFQIELAEVLH